MSEEKLSSVIRAVYNKLDSEEPVITEDTGSHYRYSLRVDISQTDIERGYINVKLDPFRIAEVYKLGLGIGTILKKCLACGKRGHNTVEEDLKDIICAAQRMLEMLSEDRHS